MELYTSIFSVLTFLAHEGLQKAQADNTEAPAFVTKYLNDTRNAKMSSLVTHPAFKSVKSYSGYFTVNEQNANLFFWYFPSAVAPEEAPLILWLQGTLGMTTLHGIFEENGPFIVDANGNITLREFSWHTYQNILYIDSPVGTGFSFTSGEYVSTMDEATQHLYEALRQFFTIFNELDGVNFYIAGEGLGGLFIPNLASVIHKKNLNVSDEHTRFINLRGLLLGNAWFDPVNMCIWSQHLFNLGLIDEADKVYMKQMETNAVKLIKKQKYAEALVSIRQIIFDNTSYFYNATELMNTYNYMLDEFDSQPHNFVALVQKTEFQRALHVSSANFSTFSEDVYRALANETLKSSARLIQKLLKHYQVLFYTGQLNILVGYPLVANAIEKLVFDDDDDFAQGYKCAWYVEDTIAGFVKDSKRLTDALVRRAGHKAIMDQPKYVYDLMYRFARNLEYC